QVDHVWFRVKALKEFTILLNPDEAKSIEDATGQPLDADPTPNSKKKVMKVAEGTVLELDPQTAQQYLASHDVEPVAEQPYVYVRTLRDYARLYRDLNLKIEDLLRVTAEVASENAAVLDAQQKVNKDIEYRTSEIAALKRDLTRYQAEEAMVKKHVAALEA